MHITKGDFLLSDNKDQLNIEVIHGFLTNSYWAKGISQEIVEKSIQHSLCFGVYKQNNQIGFARIISDYATFAYLADVFILESARGNGLAKWMVELIKKHPDLQGLRRWLLATSDAHSLYAQYGGFTPITDPGIWMEIRTPYE
ncbi:GNAT family N-acetyltransferase [marine bacterium AO1-C]|nr:GNAT family N-acetyltransferase [marine bacterium AO1-C]